MDKNAIKKYAVWARKELIVRVTQKAEQYEITEKKTTPADADSIGGRVLTAAEKKQRQALIAKINQDGFEQVMEEVVNAANSKKYTIHGSEQLSAKPYQSFYQ